VLAEVFAEARAVACTDATRLPFQKYDEQAAFDQALLRLILVSSPFSAPSASSAIKGEH
jgi:hypothetical protein